MADYFGGVVASSRSPDGRSDRGASWASLIGRLARDDIRLHYLLYERWRALLLRRHRGVDDPNLGDTNVRVTLCMTYVPLSELSAGLEVEPAAAWSMTLDALQALQREALIEDQPWVAAPPEDLQRYAPGADEPGVVVCPSHHGLQLFYWAHGQGGLGTNALHQPDVNLAMALADLPRLADGARLCEDMKADTAPSPRPSDGRLL
jgi:hypothetical protein